LRVFFLISGAKILTATTEIESLVNAMARIFSPLERIGIPVKEFFATMGLAMRYLPAIREQTVAAYREEMQSSAIKGLWPRMMAAATFMIPLFVQSIQSPEQFISNGKDHE
jgi:energy-coupling factor transport system permease protein